VNFGGSQIFQAWSTKAAILDSLGRNTEAGEVMKKALPYGDVNELYFYARSLTRQKKGKEAFEIFKINYDKHPNLFLTNAGMARGYSAIGDYKKALSYAQKARVQAPGKPNQDILDKMITKLQDGKDVN
jgi:tetratricopeptide (TPR) repeat protein